MKTIPKLLKLALLLSAFNLTLQAADLINQAGASHVGLGGYDPVAFFSEGRPVHGDPGLKAGHQSVTYFFASESHRQRFLAAPDRYVPQYGGYCAFGVSVGALFPVDVATWQILDGKLYLVLNPEVRKAFDQDPSGTIAKAEKNWPGLVRKNSN